MCERCDRLVELLGQTRSGESWVETTLPGGEPRLATWSPEEQEAG
jgi:hypothetical protein